MSGGFPQRHALQPERTALAWQRTAITALVSLVPPIVLALRLGLPMVALGGALAAVLGAPLVVLVRRRFRELHDDDRGYSPFVPMTQVAVVTVLAATGGAVIGVAAAAAR